MSYILVVDDDQLMLKLVNAALKKAGHAVALAKDGYEALDKLRQETFDLVVSDANMPGVSGFDLVATMRSDPQLKQIPVLFLTGRREERDVIKALNAGADDYALKPLDADIFLGKVESLIKKSPANAAFSSAPVKVDASLKIELRIESVSEQGAELVSPIELLPNTKLQIESTFWATVGMNSPQMRVIGCANHTGAKAEYRITVSFIGLGEKEHQAIRKWVMANSGYKSQKVV